VLSEIELLAANHSAAEELLRELCEAFTRIERFSRLASTACELADVLVSIGSIDEAHEWTTVARRHTAPDDLHAQVRWYPVRAKIDCHKGEVARATELARQGVRLSESSDELNRRAKNERDLAEVLQRARDMDGAAAAFDRAIELYEQKGNVAGATQTREQRGDLVLA